MVVNIGQIDKKLRLESAIQELVSLYAEAQHELGSILNEVDMTDFRKYRTNMILKQIDAELAFLNSDIIGSAFFVVATSKHSETVSSK